MEQVNKFFEEYKEAMKNDKQKVASRILKDLNKLEYTIEQNEQTKEYELKQMQQQEQENNNENINNNKKENDNMETIYTVNYKGIDVIISELFNERLNKEAYEKIDDSTLNIYVDKISEEFKNNLFFIAYELDYRMDNMKKSYPELKSNIHYNRDYARKSCAIFMACRESRMERYEETFETYDYTTFVAYDVEEEETFVHYIVYNLRAGEKAELKAEVESSDRIANCAHKAVKGVKKVANVVEAGLNEGVKVMPHVAKVAGAGMEFVGAAVNSVGAELAHKGLKVYNKTINGDYVEKRTLQGICLEWNKAVQNTSRVKSMLTKNNKKDSLY